MLCIGNFDKTTHISHPKSHQFSHVFDTKMPLFNTLQQECSYFNVWMTIKLMVFNRV